MLSRSRLRSELSTNSSAETKRLLNKIKGLFAQKSSHLVFQIGYARFNAKDCASVAIDETQATGTIIFQRPPALSAVKASATIQGMTFQADTTGAGGNAITVALTTGATAGAEVVSVVGNAISVQIQTGVSTRTQVKAALDASGPAAALIDTSVVSGATAVTAPVAPTALTGGVTATATETYDLADIMSIKRLRTKKWLIRLTDTANPA